MRRFGRVVTFVVSLTLSVVASSEAAILTMATGRSHHTATLLPTGKVLIAGGGTASAELFDPATDTFTPTGAMSTVRSDHTALLLSSGKVLIAGGFDGSSNPIATAETYDPESGVFTRTTGDMTTGRAAHTATLLHSGLVLLAGGKTTSSAATATAELFDPSTSQFTSTAPSVMSVARYGHSATILPNGNVFIAGGDGTIGSTAEMYVASTGTFSLIGPMLRHRRNHTATLVTSGKVLMTGGDAASASANAENYNPTDGSFTAAGTIYGNVVGHTATLLPDTRVLITGGEVAAISNKLILFNGSIVFNGTMTQTRSFHTATLLSNGKVLLAGGNSSGGASASAEVFDIDTVAPVETAPPTGSLAVPRQEFTSTLLPNGTVLAAGGYDGMDSLFSTEVFDGVQSFSSGPPMKSQRRDHTATLLANGSVLIAGGFDGTTSLASTEIYDGNGFADGPAMSTTRHSHTATLLPNGNILVAGGWHDASVTATAEVYSPTKNAFTPTSDLLTSRVGHGATLLPNGKVLITGGFDGTNYLSSVELYDPFLGTFTAAGQLVVPRSAHTATLLPSGRVLIIGGYNGAALASIEEYDPATNTSTEYGAIDFLGTARYHHTATLLPTGKVLIAGGSVSTATLVFNLLDPVTHQHALVNSSTQSRQSHTATLLPSRKVLVCGGAYTAPLASADLYDPNDSAGDARRPSITTSPSAVQEPSMLTVSGTKFTGDTEGSSGTSRNSPTNDPILELERVDNEQIVLTNPGSPWSDTALTTEMLTGLPSGYYFATIVTNALPSTAKLIAIRRPSIAAPAAMTATAQVPPVVQVSWSASPDATSYAILRRDAAKRWFSIVAVTAAPPPYSDSSAALNTAYLYSVRAVNGQDYSDDGVPDVAVTIPFTDDPLVANTTAVRAAHLDELRTAANKVRELAALPPVSFADDPVAGVFIRKVHIDDVISALDPALETLGLATLPDQDIVAGTTPITGTAVTHVRDAVK